MSDYSSRTSGIIACLVGSILLYIAAGLFLIVIALILKHKKPRDVVVNNLRDQFRETDALRMNDLQRRQQTGSVYRQFVTLSTSSDDLQPPSPVNEVNVNKDGYINPALELVEEDVDFRQRLPATTSYA